MLRNYTLSCAAWQKNKYLDRSTRSIMIVIKGTIATVHNFTHRVMAVVLFIQACPSYFSGEVRVRGMNLNLSLSDDFKHPLKCAWGCCKTGGPRWQTVLNYMAHKDIKKYTHKCTHTHKGTKTTMHSHTDIARQNLFSSKKKKKQIESVFLSQILVTDGLEIAFSIPVWCTSAGGLSLFSLLPLLWEMEKERTEEEVIAWSDSQRVALIRSMAERTVFTDLDSLLQSLYCQLLGV